MNEQDESEFAATLGKMLGFLSRDDIKRYLQSCGIEVFSIENARFLLRYIADKAFYTRDKR